ncbi:MAG: phosphoribosylaminoimidazolesuccinocarboxamide synthase [Patescibacteria group bacterium]
MPNILKETNFKHLGTKKIGKVRDVYVQKDKIILVSTNRHSSFDRIIAHIPHKGQVLTQSSLFWFEKTKDIVQNHVLANPDPNVVIGKKCSVIPIEMVVRGYITGSTNTSLWTLYENGQRDFGDFKLLNGMKKNDKLKIPVITPTTKSDEHDEPLTGKEILKRKIVSPKLWKQLQTVALKLFLRGQRIAKSRGLILVDTKYEFGLDDKGKLTLIDEIHTPDSSRWWKEGSQDFMDKEFLRMWFKDHCDPYKDKVLPAAPPKMIAELSRRYIQIYEQLTGKKFKKGLPRRAKAGATPIAKRIEKNLKKYQI